MQTTSIDFVCPRCRGHLKANHCPQCHINFPETLGILDLRWPPPTTSDPLVDRFEAIILAHYDTATAHELMDLCFEEAMQDGRLPQDHPDVYLAYFADLFARGQRMMEMFQTRLQSYYTLPAQTVALDVGCGVGTGSLVLAQQFKHVIGIDASLPPLLIGQKLLSEQGIENVTLAQAYAQTLPLSSQLIDYAVAQNVIEHLQQVPPAFAEIRRILKSGGCFCGDSRNRFDLFLPEPHVKLRWVGFWPRRWQAWYVRQLRQTSYDDTYLLSFFDLQQSAKRIFGASSHVIFPLSVAYGRSNRWDALITQLERIPILRTVALTVFPSHLLIAQTRS